MDFYLFPLIIICGNRLQSVGTDYNMNINKFIDYANLFVCSLIIFFLFI